MVAQFGLFTIGLLLLYFGAEGLVRGSSALALRIGITPLVVGLTVVAFGTSSPELLVCLMAVFEAAEGGVGDALSVGNIIGSNIANILLILGCASLIRPLSVRSTALKREYPIMVGASLLMLALIVFDDPWALYNANDPDAALSRLDGVILASCMVVYLVYSYVSARYEDRSTDADDETISTEELEDVEDVDPDETLVSVQLLKIGAGIIGLILGAYLMVESAVELAKYFGVPEVVIGISIVALGTSLPELATSAVAALREESDISVGNVIGSNIFNILLVMGTVAMLRPLNIKDRVLYMDLWVMLLVALGTYPILRSNHRISRLEGAMMLIIYVGYIGFLFYRSPTAAVTAGV
jgi:cation:H+ antiporter